MLVTGMTHYDLTNSAIIVHGFHLPVGRQAVTFVRLLAKIHLGARGCLCSVVCFCFGFGWSLEDVLLSQLPGELDTLPSGKQLQLLGDPA